MNSLTQIGLFLTSCISLSFSCMFSFHHLSAACIYCLLLFFLWRYFIYVELFVASLWERGALLNKHVMRERIILAVAQVRTRLTLTDQHFASHSRCENNNWWFSMILTQIIFSFAKSEILPLIIKTGSQFKPPQNLTLLFFHFCLCTGWRTSSSVSVRAQRGGSYSHTGRMFYCRMMTSASLITNNNITGCYREGNKVIICWKNETTFPFWANEGESRLM